LTEVGSARKRKVVSDRSSGAVTFDIGAPVLRRKRILKGADYTGAKFASRAPDCRYLRTVTPVSIVPYIVTLPLPLLLPPPCAHAAHRHAANTAAIHAFIANHLARFTA
jgi:hypothetical protein